ncbi:MAG: glycerate kinase [Promethearchaeota archaeon]
MLIKNYDQIISEELPERYKILREILLNALEKALNSIKPDKLIEKAIKINNDNLVINEKLFNLKAYRRIYIIGGGKATAKMALSLEKILIEFGNIDYEGIVNVPTSLDLKEKDFPKKVKINFASHPTPDLSGLNGTRAMMKMIEKASEEDLIICLISGGGSALLPLPKGKISIEDLKEINLLLLASGASIDEINTIRKHISNFKGGNLAKRVYECSKGTLIALIISDVIGNKLDIIASGPTIPDSTTYQDAYTILSKYKIIEKIPRSIKEVIEEGLNNSNLENPKEGDIYFRKVYSYLIGSVEIAVQEISKYLSQLGIACKYFSNQIAGEARFFARKLYDIISNEVKAIQKDEKIALIGTGELTVTIMGNGIGGRNQEMLLSYLNLIRYEDVTYNYCLLAVNLDGIEGNSKAMGALIDNNLTVQINSQNANLEEYLNDNNSNTFFKRFNSEIITGLTGSNVNDLVLVILSKSKLNIKTKK